MRAKLILVLLAISALTACGQEKVPVFAVYNEDTLTCKMAEKMASALPEDDSMYRAAVSKLSFCEAAWNSGYDRVIVGRYRSATKLYEFETIDWNNAVEVRRLCLDIAAASDIVDRGPAEMSFVTTWDTFECDWLPAKLAEKGAAVMITPTHLPLLLNVDPVIVLATGATPRLEGVPPRYYEEVTDLLERAIAEFDER